MNSELSKVMEAISIAIPPKKLPATENLKKHCCKLFIRNQGGSGMIVKAFICLECGHKTFSPEDLSVFCSNYQFNTEEVEVSLEPYWEFYALQLQEAALKLKQEHKKALPCKICEFMANRWRKVNY